MQQPMEQIENVIGAHYKQQCPQRRQQSTMDVEVQELELKYLSAAEGVWPKHLTESEMSLFPASLVRPQDMVEPQPLLKATNRTSFRNRSASFPHVSQSIDD